MMISSREVSGSSDDSLSVHDDDEDEEKKITDIGRNARPPTFSISKKSRGSSSSSSSGSGSGNEIELAGDDVPLLSDGGESGPVPEDDDLPPPRTSQPS